MDNSTLVDDLGRQAPAQRTRPLDAELKQMIGKIANTIRQLTIDAVQKANSGHPGLPMGCAEIGAYLWAHGLRYYAKDPLWLNRDRFILSAGHGSMLLYSVLHLAGYGLTIEDLKKFRQLHSHTPGHPESLDTVGVETTTGPLGQGFANAVGQALGLKLMQAKFNTDERTIFDSKVFVLMGDGCIMEGVTSEASSFAGHLQINNLIAIYDSNKITLDGDLIESCSENTNERYKSYGWDVFEIDGYNLEAFDAILTQLRQKQERPAMIIAHTVIGKGSPHKAGTHKVHGSPLGPDEVEATKVNLGLSKEPFFVPQVVYDFFDKKQERDKAAYEEWKRQFEAWSRAYPDRAATLDNMYQKRLPDNLEELLKAIEIKGPIAGRKASQQVIETLGNLLPQLYGGSADLSESDLTMMKAFPIVSPRHFNGRNIKFGVREFAMACAATGMFHTQLITPFVGTFLTFSDYMRNAIRLSALMRAQVIYQFTHDSIFLGEDGPTHQPVEHYAALRAIPNLQVIRPADANEVKMAWIAALRYYGPTALLLSRQNLPILEATNKPYSEGMGRGAYIIKKEKEGHRPDFTLLATGSEVSLALNVAAELERLGKEVRVISMPCWEIFEAQGKEYKEEILGGDIGKRVSIEAGVEMGWHKYIGRDGIAISQDKFGASAPAQALAQEFGFTVESILERIM